MPLFADAIIFRCWLLMPLEYRHNATPLMPLATLAFAFAADMIDATPR